jgi:ribulose-phosphate 3-epimerase
MTKVSRLRKLYPTLDIEVDGGVNVATIEQCTKAGANVIVSGSGVFKHASPSEAIAIMRKSVETNVLKRHTAASNEKENKHL